MIKDDSSPISLGKTNRQRNLHGQVVQEIGSRIVRGLLKPMDVLPDEETMGSRLGVSRTVVREAIKALAAKGLVETRTRRGTRILPESSWNRLDPDLLSWMDQAGKNARFLEQLTEMRKIVEPAAAGLAATRAAADDIDNITSAYEAMQNSLHDEQTYADADTDFHTAILEASGNAFLKPLTHVIRAALHTSLKVTNPIAHSATSLPLHLEILEAIRARDPERAAEAMRCHLDYTWRRIHKELGSDNGA